MRLWVVALLFILAFQVGAVIGQASPYGKATYVAIDPSTQDLLKEKQVNTTMTWQNKPNDNYFIEKQRNPCYPQAVCKENN